MWRLLAAGALVLAPASALAQEAPPPATNTTSTDAVGAPELKNFRLNGTVTRQADQPVAVPPAATTRQQPAERQPSPALAAQPRTPATTPSTERRSTAPAPAPRQTKAAVTETPFPVSQASRAIEPLRQSPPSSSVTVALPRIDSDAPAKATAAATTPATIFPPDPDTSTLAPSREASFLPWLLAAIALGAGGAYLFWRHRGGAAVAGGPQIDAFSAPEPLPPRQPVRAPPATAPAPIPEARAPLPPQSIPGLVSTRLRPWMEIGFNPLRCILEDERVTIEFELELFNSGSAPARAVLAEASIFNAGATQERDVGAFFDNPVGEGERIVAIGPLQRVALSTQVTATRTQVQAYELGGRQVFVPVIAFNALYRWSGGEGQTSVSYFVGKKTTGEKLSPFRIDLGPRIFRGLAGRLLPNGVRR